MEPKDRLKTAAKGFMSNIKARTIGKAGEQPTTDYVNIDIVKEIIQDWPALSKRICSSDVKCLRPSE